jgi:murein DD-endopeptidase MepM/ murein hydrolase activator NlpD
LAQTTDPTAAFHSSLETINQRAQMGERYTIGEMQTDGIWAYAIATPIAGSGFSGNTPHNYVPMIAVWEDERWTVIIGSPANAADFNALLMNLPATLMDQPTKDFIAQPLHNDRFGPLATQNMTGHRLPWRKGLQGFISQRDGSGHANQIDFDIQGLIASGDVVATKAGTVVFVKESSNAGACDGANFSTVWKQTNVVVVRHSASEYTWYVHLAFNSATVNVGDTVSAGTKLGVEGATGFACGIHIHYMASSAIPASWTDPANPNAAPWPPAGSVTPVDFDESPWLGLAPGNWITSQNDGIVPCPAPTVQTPQDGATITATMINASWNAVSGCTFNGYHVRVKDGADPNAGGTAITEINTGALTASLDLAAAWAYQDVYVHVRANAAGAAWATRRVRWQPQPTGSYTLFENVSRSGASFSSTQTITQLASVNFDDKARSLQVDAGVGVVLCSEPHLRGECGRATGATSVNDVNALADGLSGDVSSVLACFGECPAAPATPTLVSPAGVALSGMVALQWNGDGDEYEVEISGGTFTSTMRLPWAGGAQRNVMLPASDAPYQWRVRAANGSGSGPWAGGNFKVIEASHHVHLPITIR